MPPALAFIETRESLQRETLRSGHIFSSGPHC
jgi:hypothetical protein